MEYKYFPWLFGLLLVTGCTSPVNCNENNPKNCLRILFVGNSYTWNELPRGNTDRDPYFEPGADERGIKTGGPHPIQGLAAALLAREK
jgi:hypothetical protein